MLAGLYDLERSYCNMLVFCLKLFFAAPKWPKISNYRLREINPSILALTSLRKTFIDFSF